MVIVLTEAKTGLEFTIEAGLILCSRRVVEEVPRKRERDIATLSSEEPRAVTHVITGITAQGQLQSFSVTEMPLEIGRRQNAAMKCDIDPSLLGFKLG
jgi:hypothetical protein